MKKKILCTTLVLSMFSSVSVYAKDVSVTFPAYAVGKNMANFPEAQSSETAEDGSITYILNDQQQQIWKEYMESTFADSVKSILEDDANYPNIEDITYNGNMTEFTIKLTSFDNLTMSEWFVAYLPLFSAPMYQEINGISSTDVDYTLTTIDSATNTESKIDYETNRSSYESFLGNFTEISDDTDSNPESTNVDEISLSSDSSCLAYSGFETMPYDSSETDTLGIVKFNFTNKTDSPSDVGFFYDVHAYQNGIELDAYLGMGNTACDNLYKTVLKDATLEVGFAFMLHDLDTPITVYAYDGFTTESLCQIQEIAIQ